MIDRNVSAALAASDRIAASFGVTTARTLVATPLRDAQFSVVLLSRTYEDGENSIVLPPDDAFLVMLYLIDVGHSDILPDLSSAPLKMYAKGTICLISLKNGASISVQGQLEALAFHIPSSHLSELTSEAGQPRIGNLETCRGVEDEVIRDLGAALLPMFDMPTEVSDRLLSHLALAFNAHLAHRYGLSPRESLSVSGLLTSTQEKRIKTYITANLSRLITVDQIAAASGFAVDQLRSGFKATTGQTIHEWISACRVTKAKATLSRSGATIARVAETCGFTSEGEFFKTFTHAVGITPDEWRSRNRH